MSAGYKPVSWNRAKAEYDLAVAAICIAYLITFTAGTLRLSPYATIETALIRAFGTLALLLLHLILAIGPLCRLWPVFLPLLYNRRHLGVTMFLMATGHAAFSLVQFHALGNRNPVASVLDATGGFPFQALGLLAWLILLLMAATSHDFWLHHLTAPVWKRLHMMVYLAYALLVGHVAFGALRSENSGPLTGALLAGMAALIGLHLAAARKGAAADREAPREGALIPVCHVDEIPENRARIVCASQESVAVFRYDGKLSAVSGVCQHQNGPLGEGRIIDGCITCPWHGYQYLPDSGLSPPPFTEKLPVFRLELRGTLVLLDPRPLPAGTRVEPVRIEGSTERTEGQ